MIIKAIETEYNGYRFRSRLEARWAVFFDTLGIKYEYEKEGYDLDGVWYLPDFWLPEQKCWIEIKGQQYPTNEEYIKAEWLALAEKKNVFILAGGIGRETVDYLVHSFVFYHDSEGVEQRGDWGWCQCYTCKKIEIVSFSIYLSCSCKQKVKPASSSKYSRPIRYATSKQTFDTSNVFEMASLKARQARFEHGENGR